jgi:hypothetical protein
VLKKNRGGGSRQIYILDFIDIFAIRENRGGNMISVVRTFLGACLFVALCTGFVRSAEEAGQKQDGVPIIILEEPTFDFGQVSQGEVVTHDFRVVNNGTAPLEIKQVKPG